jgi:hypothetical protein
VLVLPQVGFEALAAKMKKTPGLPRLPFAGRAATSAAAKFP